MDNGNGTGTFDWTPGFFQDGVYNVTFQAVDTAGGMDLEVVAITVTNNNGPSPLMFKVSGYDNRNASGIGVIQMVNGSVTRNQNPNSSSGGAQRQFLTITITPEPSMLLGASGALAALILSHTVVRRRSKKS